MEQGFYGGNQYGNDINASQSSRNRIGRLFGRDQQRQSAYAPPIQPPQPASQYGYAPGAPSVGGVVIYSPKTYAEVQLLIDHLKAHEQVIVDFSTINQTSVYRILDFMSGAIYALGGSIKQIKKDLYLFVPSGVTITAPPQYNR